jgi:pre-mRNA-processing factor SLU7
MKNPFGDESKWGTKETTTADDVSLDPQKLMDALRKEDERLKTGEEEDGEKHEKRGEKRNKRGYHADREEAEPTEEEMEAFRMKRKREDDPMAAKDAGTKGYDLV